MKTSIKISKSSRHLLHPEAEEPFKFIKGHSFLILIFLSIILTHCKPATEEQVLEEGEYLTPLDLYVQSEDPAYHFEVQHQSKGERYTFYVLKMISQTWLTPDLVAEPTWWHWVTVVVPDTVSHDAGMLWIGGGASDDELPLDPSPLLLEAALSTNTVTAGIHNVPNQPLTFSNDTIEDRYEDALIAYGWRKFLEEGADKEDAIWLARLPMTKSVVSAMDAVSEFVKNEHGKNIDEYVVSGASKRGWTTWTTAAVDDRVIAIAPIVIDLLNIVPSFEHHWQNYGFWAPAIDDYVHEGIMDWMRTEEFDNLLHYTGPYSYRERYDIPKFLINASGDQFFQPDSWQFYWEDLPGEKHLRYVPNTGHSLRETDALETLLSYYQSIINEDQRPGYSWDITGSVIHIETDPDNPPVEMKLWSASNTETRDFRIDVIGEAWQDSTLSIDSEGIYNIELTIPEKGWSAYFVELKYPGPYQIPMKVTTGIEVLPNDYPFEPFVSSKPKEEQ